MNIQDFDKYTELGDFSDIVSSVFGDEQGASLSGSGSFSPDPTDSPDFFSAAALNDDDLQDISEAISSIKADDDVENAFPPAEEEEAPAFSAGFSEEAEAHAPAHLRTDAPAEEAEAAPAAHVEDEIEFDPRFRTGRKDAATKDFSYGGRRVSSTQELGYAPSAPQEYEELRSSYTEADSYDALFREKTPDDPPAKGIRKIASFAKRLKTPDAEPAAPAASSPDAGGSLEEFHDDLTSGAAEADLPEDAPGSFLRRRFHAERSARRSREDDSPESVDVGDELAGEYEGESEYLQSSFGKYLYSRLATFLLKIRGYFPANTTAASMMQEDENLGAEMPPLAASKYYGAEIASMRMRTRIAAGIVVFMVYLSSGLPLPGMLRALPVGTAALMAAQFTVMLLSLDVVTNAITKTFRKKFGIDTLCVIACLLTTLDGIAVLNSGNVYKHLPLCAVSSLSLMGVLLSSLFSARALRKALRVPGIAKTIYSVTTEDNVTGHDVTILKSDRPISGFLRRVEEAPVDEAIFGKAAPFILALAFLFTLLVCIFRSCFENILYVFSVFVSAGVPFTALLCFALPYFYGSNRIFSSGAALAGWSGIFDIGNSRTLIVTDRDLFPPENIEISSVRIFADYDADKVISYVSSLIIASGCGLVPAFKKLMDDNNCAPVRIDNLKFLAGGGFSGMAEGHSVICGSTDLMRLVNVRVPYKLITDTSVLLAIDGVLFGIFTVNYTADPNVRKALVNLMRSNRHPIFAIRDFNITPEFIHDCFDVATDGYDFPPYIDRFRISEATPSGRNLIAAVVCKEGLGPLTDVADTGRSVYTVTKTNLAISLAASFLGIFISFLRLMVSGAVKPGFLLLLMILFSLPVLVLSFFTTSVN